MENGQPRPPFDDVLRGEAATSPGGEEDQSGSAIDARVGRYQVRGLLGSGGMGQVYEAFDPELDRAIALKVMRPELTRMPGVLAERLVRESRLAAKVVDPAVIVVHDVGRTGDAVFIAMELIRGETLGAYVRRAQPPWRAIVELLGRAGRGLAAAHAAGVIHRDFKPDNVLVELDGARAARVVVTDFGVARAFADELDAPPSAGGARATPASHEPALTTTGMAVGTPAYMSPQQLESEPVDHRTDVFAFAVTAWEMLFGERPYGGATAAALRVAMERPPVPPRGHAVPMRVIRAVERGLAVEPSARWPDMTAFLRALAAAARPQHRTVAVAAVACAALAGAALVGARAAAEAPLDPCAAGLAAIDRADEPGRASVLRALLAGNPRGGGVVARLERAIADWRGAQRATCRIDADPVQPANVAACLEARRLEITSFVDDVLAGGALGVKFVTYLGDLIGDPAACRDPAPGLLIARVPADPAVRRRVTAARYRLFDADLALERGDFQSAIATARGVLRDDAGWPPLQSEALFKAATAEYASGDKPRGMTSLREAAALAGRLHYDMISAAVWIQLAQIVVLEASDAPRGLEYIAYGEAAVERIGRPPRLTAYLEYTHGMVLAEAARRKEAEVHMRRAFELAAAEVPELVPLTIQGLGVFLELEGRFVEASDAYRRALGKLAERPSMPYTDVGLRRKLAFALAAAGQIAEAESVMREAVQIADRSLAATDFERPVTHLNLAEVLGKRGQTDEALAIARAAAADLARITGERSERYGEALTLVATLLTQQARFAEAARQFERACDVIAFGAGEDSFLRASCWLGEIDALIGLRRFAAALPLAEQALPIMSKTYGERHVQVATAYLLRGRLRFELGRGDAIEDLERARTLLEGQSIDPGHLASAEAALGRALWKTAPVRARALVEQAVERSAGATGQFARSLEEARAWLAAHPAQAPR